MADDESLSLRDQLRLLVSGPPRKPPPEPSPYDVPLPRIRDEADIGGALQGAWDMHGDKVKQHPVAQALRGYLQGLGNRLTGKEEMPQEEGSTPFSSALHLPQLAPWEHGTGEALQSLVQSQPATAYAGLKGLHEGLGAWNKDDPGGPQKFLDTAGHSIHETEDQYNYRPQSAEGQRIMGGVGKGMEKVSDLLHLPAEGAMAVGLPWWAAATLATAGDVADPELAAELKGGTVSSLRGMRWLKDATEREIAAGNITRAEASHGLRMNGAHGLADAMEQSPVEPGTSAMAGPADLKEYAHPEPKTWEDVALRAERPPPGYLGDQAAWESMPAAARHRSWAEFFLRKGERGRKNAAIHRSQAFHEDERLRADQQNPGLGEFPAHIDQPHPEFKGTLEEWQMLPPGNRHRSWQLHLADAEESRFPARSPELQDLIDKAPNFKGENEYPGAPKWFEEHMNTPGHPSLGTALWEPPPGTPEGMVPFWKGSPDGERYQRWADHARSQGDDLAARRYQKEADFYKRLDSEGRDYETGLTGEELDEGGTLKYTPPPERQNPVSEALRKPPEPPKPPTKRKPKGEHDGGD